MIIIPPPFLLLYDNNGAVVAFTDVISCVYIDSDKEESCRYFSQQ